MARIKAGWDLDTLKANAEQSINDHFREVRHRQGFYAHKVAEAHRVLAGAKSDLIAKEARKRQVRMADLAQTIVTSAAADEETELRRVDLILKVRKANGLVRLQKIVKPLGIEIG